MFSNMYFQKGCKIDANRRIVLPTEAKAEEGREVLIAKKPEFYEIFLLERVSDLVRKMEMNFYQVKDEERQEILKDLNYIFSIAVRTSKVDAQRRIAMPNELAPGSDIILQGRDSSIALFPDERAYEAYINQLETRSIL